MRSLLSDIREGTPPPRDDVRAVRDAVVANLRQICATPRGSALLWSDYGLEDATRIFHEYPGSVGEVQRRLADAFTRYEPRLANVDVKHVPGDDTALVLRFDITGTLLVAGRPVAVRFTSSLDADSRMELR